jgi:hypothetical protein
VALHLGLAEQAQRRIGLGERGLDAGVADVAAMALEQDRRRGRRPVLRDVRDRQAEDRTHMQRELREILGDHRHHAGVVRAR